MKWVVLLALVGCDKATTDAVISDSAACSNEPALDYDNFGEGLMIKHCTACHSSYLVGSDRNGAPLGVDLDSYSQVMTYAERIQARVIDPEVPTMPPGGGPDADELTQLAEWLTCGVLPDKAAWETQQ